MKPSTAVRRALEELGRQVAPPRPAGPIRPAGDSREDRLEFYRELRSVFGSNAAIARAAGHRVGTKPYNNFMRNLQRYAKGGERAPRITLPALSRASEPLGRRPAIEIALQAIREAGVTINAEILLEVSSTERWRTIDDFYLEARELRAFLNEAEHGRWDSAGEELFNAWSEAYGIGQFVVVLDVEYLELQAGRVRKRATA